MPAQPPQKQEGPGVQKFLQVLFIALPIIFIGVLLFLVLREVLFVIWYNPFWTLLIVAVVAGFATYLYRQRA